MGGRQREGEEEERKLEVELSLVCWSWSAGPTGVGGSHGIRFGISVWVLCVHRPAWCVALEECREICGCVCGWWWWCVCGLRTVGLFSVCVQR